MDLSIHIDGAARGNPGPACLAYVIHREGKPDIEDAEQLGRATNNVAEYTALVRALERAVELGATGVKVYSDSLLVVRQVKGEYRVKDATLRDLYSQVQQLLRRFARWEIDHIPREENRRADELCNLCLDGKPALARPKAKAVREAAPPGPSLPPGERWAVELLRQAAESWADGDPRHPEPEDVWRQLRDLLAEHGFLHPPVPR
jgi:ribonuclease HI